MARILVNIGDELFVRGKLYEVMGDGGDDLVLSRVGLCEACHLNTGDDFTTPYGNLCAPCIERAMEGYVLQRAMQHVMSNDPRVIEVMHIMERVDGEARKSNQPFVDFHSSSIDTAYAWRADEWTQITRKWIGAIKDVLDARETL